MSIEIEWRKQMLNDDYNYIIERIKGGKYGGKEIDIDNIKELVVGAYYVGKLDNPLSKIYTNIYPKE